MHQTISPFAVAFAGGLLLGQQTVSGQQTNRRPDPATVESQLEQNRPKAAPIAPSSPAPGPLASDPLDRFRADDRELLWPEDFLLAGRQGRIRHNGQWWEFVFAPTPEGGTDMPVRVLPNSKLRQMVTYARTTNGAAEFGITGLITEYRGQNYILAKDVTILSRRSARPPATGSQESDSNSGLSILEQLERDTTTVRPLGSRSDESASQDSSASEPGQRPSALSRDSGGLLREGTRVSGQVGRLVRESDWWVFVFESASDTPAEVPARLLPNLSLSSMEDLSAGRNQSPIFVVSAELTLYDARNYMLIRRFRIRRDDGNIK